jgi:hypothetical protein
MQIFTNAILQKNCLKYYDKDWHFDISLPNAGVLTRLAALFFIF